MKEPVPYEVIAPYGYYSKGDIIFPTGTFRDLLQGLGYIRPAGKKKEKEPKTIEIGKAHEGERALLVDVKRGRGRPPGIKNKVSICPA